MSSEHVVALCTQLEEARTRHEAFHNRLDDPLEVGTPEFEEANRLLTNIENQLAELAEAAPADIRSAEAMTAAVLAHAGELRPSVYRMLEQVHGFLAAFRNHR